MLDVLFENVHLIAVAKPSGMVVHRGWADDAITAADVVRDEIVKAPVHAVHRLDRGTSGVLLFAKNSDSARTMQELMTQPTFEKRYLALVRGPMLDPCLLDHAITQREQEGRIDAVTEFIPLAHSDRWSLVEARPHTGRVHQIRKHLKHLSHPIVGDVRYGKGDVNRFFREHYNLNRLALHCSIIQFEHPDFGPTSIHAPMPIDLRETMEKLFGTVADQL